MAAGLVGTGPGRITRTDPAVHTDPIIAAIVGGAWREAWILAMFAVLTGRGLRAATRSRDSYAAILGAGLSIAIGLQAVLIIAGVVRLLPLTGIPLPFVSYGLFLAYHRRRPGC
jgi:cell division protein FtsW (lipid II flippase)